MPCLWVGAFAGSFLDMWLLGECQFMVATGVRACPSWTTVRPTNYPP